MSSTPPPNPEQSVKDALSAPRLGTYEAATTGTSQLSGALALYGWNAQVSAAMLAPLHLCEVVIRNAVADALAAAHGPQWPWDAGFMRSLPNPGIGYNPRRDIVAARTGRTTTGKVIPELKFVFWQTMFTSRFDARLWSLHLRTILPHADATKTVAQVRALVYHELEQLRKLRNRIAHHEPIFTRNLADDFQKVHDLIAFRCPFTAVWMTNNQQASALIAAKPP
jgi:hypothetical protein